MKINVNKGIKWAMRHWKTLLAVFVTGGVISIATENEYQKGLEDGALANTEGVKRALQKKIDNPEATDDTLAKEYRAGAQQYFDDVYK
jgi:hypothetical protein